MLNDEALTVDDVAELLHVGRNLVYSLAKEGDLASYRIGRKLRFTRADVERYIARSHRGPASGHGLPGTSPTARASTAAGMPPEGALVLSGNDLIGDVLAHHCNDRGLPVSRAYAGSYFSLVDLYFGRADAALVHLYDRKTNSYNVPAIQRVAPGMPVIVIRLVRRYQGFFVASGNPKHLTTWGSLLGEGVRLANRERGCGTRVLLDEKLVGLEARPDAIEGYDREIPSALSVASFVEQGAADVGLGTERLARQVDGIDFVPLQQEWLDLAVAKSERTARLVWSLTRLAADPHVQQELAAMGYDTSGMGAIVYEC